MAKGEYEQNPIMLQSEHKRILASAQERYDEKLKERYTLGCARGAALGAYGAIITAILGIAAGFLAGASLTDTPSSKPCVPMYDTGVETCQ